LTVVKVSPRRALVENLLIVVSTVGRNLA